MTTNIHEEKLLLRIRALLRRARISSDHKLTVGQLIRAIHAVANGNFRAKVNLKYPKKLRKLDQSSNQMTDELAGIEILRSDFINNFSHESKTPIISIMGFAKLLKEKNLSAKEKEECLDMIISECKHLSDLYP